MQSRSGRPMYMPCAPKPLLPCSVRARKASPKTHLEVTFHQEEDVRSCIGVYGLIASSRNVVYKHQGYEQCFQALHFAEVPAIKEEDQGEPQRDDAATQDVPTEQPEQNLVLERRTPNMIPTQVHGQSPLNLQSLHICASVGVHTECCKCCPCVPLDGQL